MTITQDQIRNIVENLSKLKPQNEKKLLKEVNQILEYIKLLDEVDTSGISPTVSVISNKNTLKNDVVKTDIDKAKKLLECSSEKIVNNQIVLQNIMK